MSDDPDVLLSFLKRHRFLPRESRIVHRRKNECIIDTAPDKFLPGQRSFWPEQSGYVD